MEGREEAVTALTDAAAQDSGVEQEPSVDTGTPNPYDLDSPNVPIDALPPEAQKIVKGFQADYTQKMQRISPLMQASQRYGGDPNEVLNRLDFVERFSNDPQTQLEVYNSLSGHLQEMGMTPQQANQAASQAIQEEMSDDDGDYEDDDEDYYDPRIDELQNQLMTVTGWVQEQKNQQQIGQIENALTQQENAIRQQNPTYSDDDINNVYSLAHATNGNLYQAQQQYESVRQGVLQNYLNTKASVNTPAPVQGGEGYGEQPMENITGVLDPRLHNEALNRLKLVNVD